MSCLTVWLNKLVRKITALLVFLSPISLAAQQVNFLKLDQANELARQNYPSIKQKDLIKETARLNINDLMKGFLPQLSLSGQATYQSDVTQVNIPVSGFKIEPPGKDQYKVVADVSQAISDGGITRQQKEMQQLNAQLEEQKIEVELYSIKERVNQLYLGVLYLDEQRKQVELIKQDIQTGVKRVEAQVQNGVAFKSNLNVLKAELLKANQRAIELNSSRNGMLEVLSLFLNQPVSHNVILEKPLIQSTASGNEITRPEIKLFADQTKLVDHQLKLIQARNQPKASLFLQGGYGRPGLNLLKNKFDLFYIGGLRFNWGLSGLYTKKIEKQLIDISKKTIDIQKETFLLNTNSQLKQQQAEIKKFQQLIVSDNEIINLREQVKNAAKAQLENGVITANDYLREVNAEDQARQTLITHGLQLLQAQINYQTISGKY